MASGVKSKSEQHLRVESLFSWPNPVLRMRSIYWLCMHLPPYSVLCRSVLNRDMRSSFFHKLETVLSKRKLTKSGGWNVFVYKRKTDVELSSRIKIARFLIHDVRNV